MSFAYIRENIAFGKPTATLEEVMEAAKVVNLHDQLESMDFGYDTHRRKRIRRQLRGGGNW